MLWPPSPRHWRCFCMKPNGTIVCKCVRRSYHDLMYWHSPIIADTSESVDPFPHLQVHFNVLWRAEHSEARANVMDNANFQSYMRLVAQSHTIIPSGNSQEDRAKLPYEQYCVFCCRQPSLEISTERCSTAGDMRQSEKLTLHIAAQLL